MSQPRTGFHVASVHSMEGLRASLASPSWFSCTAHTRVIRRESSGVSGHAAPPSALPRPPSEAVRRSRHTPFHFHRRNRRPRCRPRAPARTPGNAHYDSVAPTEALPALPAIPVRGVEEFFRGCQIVKKPERGDLVYVAKGQPLRQQETRAIEVHAPYGRVKCFHRLPLET